MKKAHRILTKISSVLKLNPELVIGGSVACELQGFQLGRDPKDVDLVVPDGTILHLPPGVEVFTPSKTSGSNGYYGSGKGNKSRDNLLFSIKVNGIKVDFIRESENSRFLKLPSGLSVVKVESIMQRKLEYVMSDKTSQVEKAKHNHDLIIYFQHRLKDDEENLEMDHSVIGCFIHL